MTVTKLKRLYAKNEKKKHKKENSLFSEFKWRLKNRLEDYKEFCLLKKQKKAYKKDIKAEVTKVINSLKKGKLIEKSTFAPSSENIFIFREVLEEMGLKKGIIRCIDDFHRDEYEVIID